MSEASIVLKANDQISGIMKSVSGNSKALSKEFEELQTRVKQLGQKNDALNKSYASVSTQVVEAKKAMKEAETAFKKTGDEESRLSFENAKKQYKDLTDAAKAYEEASRGTRKEISNTQEQMRKLGDSSGFGGGFFSGSDIASKLGQAGLIKELGSSLANAAGTLISSNVGLPASTLLGSIASGTISGTAAGSMMGIPLVGAALGAVTGAVSGGTQIFEQKDDAFKSYVQDMYDTVTQEQSDSITNGSATAAQREQDAIAFNQLLGQGKGDAYLKDLRTMAASTPLEYSDLTSMSKALATGFGKDPSRMLELMKTLGDTGSAVGIDASGMTTMAQALSRMQSSGKATLEYLNIFQDRGVDVIGILGKSLGKTQSQIYDMISAGKINGVQAVQAIQDALGTMYDGAMEKQSQTFSGVQSTLEDAQTEQDASWGIGYNRVKKEGMQKQINYLNGASGQQMQKANEAIGAWQASLENSKEQFIRDAQEAVLNSDEYKSAMASGTDEGYAEAGKMLMEAKVKGMNEYNASDGAQLLLSSEKSLADSIRDDSSTNDAYWDAGYEKGNWFTRGLAASIGGKLTNNPLASGGYYNDVDGKYYDKDGNVVGSQASSNAFGLSYVPYDNFPALLHQGERVQTAAEARAAQTPRVQVSVTGNGISVRQKSDVDAIADAIARKIERVLYTRAN